MLFDQSGKLLTNATEICGQIQKMPQDEIDKLDERKGIMRDALNSFDATLERLPQRDRDALLSMYYKKLTDSLFDFHLAGEIISCAERVENAETRKEGIEAALSLRGIAQDLLMVYDIQR